MKTTALALGFFDGVHLAHRAVLRQARDWADAHGCAACAVTFSVHPAAALAGKPQMLMQTLQDRIETLKTEGKMDDVVVLPFEPALWNTPWEDFVRDTLIRDLQAGFVSVGYDYRFGLGAQGTAEKLRDCLAGFGIPAAIVPRMDDETGEAIGTRTLRRLMAQGQAARAAAIMGRPFTFEGTVLHGKSLGHTLGFPTMNVQLPEELVRPAPGVYTARVRIGGALYGAVTNISPAGLSESFVMDFTGDTYGQVIRVYLLDFQRPMRAFDSLEALTAQVMRDRDTAAERLACLRQE